jgi:outer membrane protein OmpA-like peptidoglycan-associated protein
MKVQRLAAVLSGLCVAAALVAQGGEARAQAPFSRRFRFHLDAGAGTMFNAFQRQVLGYDRVNVAGSLRVSLEFSSFAAIQVGAGTGFFFAGNVPGTTTPYEPGRLTTVGGGVRFMPTIWRALGFSLDANANAGLMPNGNNMLTRFAFDVGLGVTYEITSFFTLGPTARYWHVLQDPASRPRPDAQFWTAGLELVFRVPYTPPPRTEEEQRGIDRGAGVSNDNADQDRDGVLDSLDVCPDQPANGNADRRRLGCPAFDTDSDGVPDNVDACRDVPQGPSPHPARPGCPDADNDRDGVGNSRDRCVEDFQGFYANRDEPGCALPDRDRDLVPDSMDACPNVAGSPNTNPDRAGCAGPVRLEREAIRTTEPIQFEADAATLNARSERVITALAEAIAAVTAIRRVVIVVPERLPGDREGGETLAEARGRDILRRLTQEGVDASRLGVRPEPVAQPERGRRAPAAQIFLSITQVVSPTVR